MVVFERPSSMAKQHKESVDAATGLVSRIGANLFSAASSCSVALTVLVRVLWPMLSNLGRGMRYGRQPDRSRSRSRKDERSQKPLLVPLVLP